MVSFITQTRENHTKFLRDQIETDSWKFLIHALYNQDFRLKKLRETFNAY